MVDEQRGASVWTRAVRTYKSTFKKEAVATAANGISENASDYYARMFPINATASIPTPLPSRVILPSSFLIPFPHFPNEI